MHRRGFVSTLLVPALLIVAPSSERGQFLFQSPKPRIGLVTPAWVAAHVKDPDVRILDVRPDMQQYFSGHVPNAVFLPDANLRGPREGLPVQYLPPAQLTRLLAQAGVTREHRVVVYSDREDVVGAMLTAYVLERIEVPRIFVMDGGWSAYAAAFPVSQTYPAYRDDVLPVRMNEANRVTIDEIEDLLGSPDARFVDTRSERLFVGLDATWMRNGHIPGAVNLDWRLLVDGANPHRLRPAEEIRRIVNDRGLHQADRLVLYCGTSREASLVYVVLKHLLGFPDVQLYEGSWTEYAAHSELPVEGGIWRTVENR